MRRKVRKGVRKMNMRKKRSQPKAAPPDEGRKGKVQNPTGAGGYTRQTFHLAGLGGSLGVVKNCYWKGGTVGFGGKTVLGLKRDYATARRSARGKGARGD